MVGRTKTAATYTPEGDDPKVAKEETEHLSHDVQLPSFGGKATSGTHRFPFSLILAADVPPTMKVRYQSIYMHFEVIFRPRITASTK